jgi:rhodanese-related sulfurtransferase
MPRTLATGASNTSRAAKTVDKRWNQDPTMTEFIDFALRNWVLFAIAFGLLTALIATELMSRLSGIKKLSPAEVTRLINNDDAQLIDLRASNDYRAAHIPGARNIAPSELKQRVKEVIGGKQRPTVVYCANGMQASSAASKLLKKEGVDSVSVLQGGLAAWREASLPVTKAKGKK